MLEAVIELVEAAGRVILSHYQEIPEIEWKADQSPLTQADRQANELLCSGLAALSPSWPIVSEELPVPAYETRKGWGPYWLVDPLDGTKEFIQRNGEFTVNVALVEDGVVRMGVVGLPARAFVYYAQRGEGAYRRASNQVPQRLFLPVREKSQPIRVAVSRSHPNQQLNDLIVALGDNCQVPLGSALKFCEIAEGNVHCYPRLQGLHEWDTAAAHIVAEEAGALVSDLQGNPLLYNKTELIHENILVVSDLELQHRFVCLTECSLRAKRGSGILE